MFDWGKQSGKCIMLKVGLFIVDIMTFLVRLWVQYVHLGLQSELLFALHKGSFNLENDSLVARFSFEDDYFLMNLIVIL